MHLLGILRSRDGQIVFTKLRNWSRGAVFLSAKKFGVNYFTHQSIFAAELAESAAAGAYEVKVSFFSEVCLVTVGVEVVPSGAVSAAGWETYCLFF